MLFSENLFPLLHNFEEVAEQAKKKKVKVASDFQKSVTAKKWHIEWNHTDPSSLCALERNPKITQPNKFLTLWNKKTFVTPPPHQLPDLLNTMMKRLLPPQSLTFHFCVAVMRRTVQNQTQLTRTSEDDDLFLFLLLSFPYLYTLFFHILRK